MPDFLGGTVRRERIGDFRVGNGGLQAGQAMGQQLQSWQSGDGEKLWLSMLIDTMEEVSRPEIRCLPCDRFILASVYAHLARPASACPHGASSFSLRN